jgi:MoaA/NifB/PqqE/SkfB family radical SAM enzyme
MKNQEWESPWNSFNSWKGLLYVEHYRAILSGKFLPPIECSVDPVNACNLDCLWCNGYDVKERNVYMDGQHLIDLVNFFKVWGAKAVCFAGGGEPTLHPRLGEAFSVAYKLGLPAAIISNGTFHDEDQLATIATLSRWVGISVDCASKELYETLKGVDLFDRVIENIRMLVNYGAREVTFKFLLHPLNQHEVYKAIELARDLGCHRIHIRPVSFMNFQKEEENYDVKSIDEQVMRGREIFENDKFKVFYVQHKFDKDMHRKFGFSKCQATPIMPIFQANGDISICIDRKADNSLVIGSHEDISQIPKIWGGKRHKQVIADIKLSECPKCTFNRYNEQIENIDKLDWEFT